MIECYGVTSCCRAQNILLPGPKIENIFNGTMTECTLKLLMLKLSTGRISDIIPALSSRKHSNFIPVGTIREYL